MNIEEDELTALRSAALATLSMKPQKAPEEDLTALRQAALMTRTQNQIEVIQRPVEQNITGWLDGGQRGSIYRPESGIPPPPPRNSNIRMIQPVGIRSPRSFPQRPPLFFSPPTTSWGANNLIHLTPGPARPVPLMSLQRHHNVNLVRPLLPFPIAPRHPQNAPAHQNFRAPFHEAFPDNANRFPTPTHQNFRVPSRGEFPDNANRFPAPRYQNSVVPSRGEFPDNANRFPAHKYQNSVVPSRGEFPDNANRFPAPRYQNSVVPARGVFPGSGYRFPRSNRPVQQAVTKMRATDPKNLPQNTPETKTTDKFNRYDPDSSSDDDEEHTAVESKQKDDESDAESVASDKSFSSVSAASEGEEKTEIHEEDKDNHNDAGETQGDISIVNEDDGILAAIEEFLDEGTSVTQPKIEQSQNASSQTSRAKPARTKILKSKKIALKPQTTPPADSTGSNAHKKTKQTASKGKKIISAPDKAETPTTKGTKSSLMSSSRPEIVPVGVRAQNLNTKDRLQQNIKKTKVPKSKKDVVLQNKEKKSEELIGASESQKPKKIDGPRPITPITVRNVPVVANKTPQAQQSVLPIQQRVELPLNEGRQRRNSDLDSVGSSDLSFLSSTDCEDEISQMPKSASKQPVRQMKRVEASSKKSAGNRDIVPSGSVRKTNIKERIGVREKYQRKLSDDEGKPQTTNRIDLRAKLKRDASEKCEDTQARPVDLREKIKHRKKVTPKTETTPASIQAPLIRKPSPISVKSDRIPSSEKKPTIISLTSKSKSQNLLANARNIVITRRRTPSPIRERDTIRFDSRKQERFSPTRESDAICLDSRKQTRFEEKRKQSSPSPTRESDAIRFDSRKQARFEEKRKQSSPSPIRESDAIRLDSRKQTRFEEKRKQSASSRATVKRMAEKDTKKLQSQILNVKVRKYKDSDSAKGTVENRKRVSAFKDAPGNPIVQRQRSPSKTSEENEAESDVVEEVDILDIYEYDDDDMLFDIDGDEENVVSSAQKQVPPRTRKLTADTRAPETYKDSSSESLSEGEVVEEIKLSSKRVPLQKRNVKHSKTNLKHSPRKRPKTVEIEQPEDPRTYKPTGGSTTGTRRVLITKKYTQDGRQKERQSKRDPKYGSSVTENYKTETENYKTETENYKTETESYKTETENYETSGKKSMKKRLGSRIVVKKSESINSKHFKSDSDDGWRAVKPRKIVKTKRKKSSSSYKDDRRLESRIQRIETQNGLILQRQREIEIEKEKFG